MKAEELRIGNYVKSNANFQRVIKEIHENTIVWYSEHQKHHIPFMHLEPIAITEEWILDFGFKIQGEFYEKWEGNLLYSYCTDNGFCFGQEMEFSYDIKVKHVHSLQNLFFALTGKELTLK